MKNYGSNKKYIMIFLLCLILGFLAYVDIFTTLDSKLQDSLLKRSGPVDTEIVLVAIDDQSLEDLGRFPGDLVGIDGPDVVRDELAVQIVAVFHPAVAEPARHEAVGQGTLGADGPGSRALALLPA